MLDGFKKFILRGNAVDLAIGIMIGAAFNSVVSALVKDIFTPIISAIWAKPDFSNLKFTINHSQFLYGDFLNSLISFLIIAVVVYFFVVLPMNKFLGRMKKQEAPTTKQCPMCIMEIPISAKKCPHCTSNI
jgi:large conductance mechanosensitive channel